MSSAAANEPVVFQGFLVKHGGFFFAKVQKRFFILKGNILTWEKRSGTSDKKKEKGSLAITGDTVIEAIDAGSNLFEFQISKFRPVKCGHNENKPYRLGSTSGEERDMWIQSLQEASAIASGNVSSPQRDSPSKDPYVDSPLSPRGRVVSAPVITVQSIREKIDDSMPGVFTATLKVMIDVDAQPAVDCITLDEAVVNLLACFAKCYGKGDAQNRRGIIQFAASKVSKFQSFVTLRFSIAARSLSYISKPLSLCSDSNFWADTSPNLQLLENESNSVRQSLSARLSFLSSVDPISSFPPFPIPVDVRGSVFASSDCSNSRNCQLFLSSHLNKARDVVEMVLSSVEGSDTSKLLAELEDIIRSQSIVLEEISTANDTLNSLWSRHIDQATGTTADLCFAVNQADAVTKNARHLLQLLNKRIAWVQSIPKIVQSLHDSQFSRIFLEFLQTSNISSKDSYSELYTLLRDVDVLVSDKVNPNGSLFVSVRQWCIQQVTELWRVYVRDGSVSLQDSSPEQFVGIIEQSQNFWDRQRAIPVLSPAAWASMNVKDDVGLEPCDSRPNSFKDFLLSKQMGMSFLMKEMDAKLDSFEQILKQKMKGSSENAALGDVLSRILACKSVIKAGIKTLSSAEEDSEFVQKFAFKYSKLKEETVLSTRKLIVKFQKQFSLESSQRISALFEPLAWVYKQSPLLSDSFLYFLQDKGAGVTQYSADCCHMLLLDVDLSFAIACIPNFQAFLELRQYVCSSFLEDYSVFMKDSSFDPASLVVDSQFHRRYVSPYFERVACALPDFPVSYSELCVQSLSLPVCNMDKVFFERANTEFVRDVSDSVHRITLLLKRYPVKDSELKFLKLLQNLPNFGSLCKNKLKAYSAKIDRYGAAYVEFNDELLSCTQDLQTRMESRDNGLTKPEKVLEKADEYIQTLTKLFSKLCKAGKSLRKVPSLLEFCAEFVNFSMSTSPDGVLSALLQLYRAESCLSVNLLPNLDSVIIFFSIVQETGFVMKSGSEWFYPSHVRSLHLSGWSEKLDADVPFMASPFFSEAAPFIQKDDGSSASASQNERDSLIFMVTENARRFSTSFKKLGLPNTDILTNKMRQSVSSLGQNIKDFSAANSLLDKTCADVMLNSSKDFTAAIVSQLFDVSSSSIKKHVAEVHEALKAINQTLTNLQDLQFSRALLKVTKTSASAFWRQTSADSSVSSAFLKLREIFNSLHAFDVKVSEVVNPDGCNYLNSMEWLRHKLQTVEDLTSQLTADQIDSVNTFHASESSSVQYWMCENAIQTLDLGAFDDADWSPDRPQTYARLDTPRAPNEAFESLLVDSKTSISDLYTFAESSVKEACDSLESQFSGYSSLKTAKSKDVPKSGPLFDEFSAVSELILVLQANLKKLKSSVESVLDSYSKLSSVLNSFQKKTEATVVKIQEQLHSITSRWEGKWSDAFKKYCKTMQTSSVHHGRLQLSQIFVDWWRVAGRSDALPIANSFMRILRCFDNDVIAFFRPATRPLLDARRHLISLRCISECDSSAIEECVWNMSECLSVEKFIWPTQVSTRPSALVTFDHSQVMESRFTDARVTSFLEELRLRMTNIKSALENARVFYKDIRDESSQAFSFSKIKSALPSFEAYLEDEFYEYVKCYSLLDEQAQNLIATRPALIAIRKNPIVLSNYLLQIAKWQRDASNLSVTGGGFIRKLPVRKCVSPLQQKLRVLILRQLYTYHEMAKNNIGLGITSAAWNFRCFSEKFRAVQLFDKIGPSFALPPPEQSESAQDIYNRLKTCALAKIAQASPSRKTLFDVVVGLIPSAVIAAEEFNKRTLLQEAIHQQVHKKMSDDVLSALLSACESWDALVQGYCSLHPFFDAMKHCTSVDVKVSIEQEDGNHDAKHSNQDEMVATFELGDLSYDFPDVSKKIRQDSEDGSFAINIVKVKAATSANVLTEQNFTEKALQSCFKKIAKAADSVKKDMKSTPSIDFSKLPELLKIVNSIKMQTFNQLRAFSEKVRSLMASVSAPLKAVHDELSTKLADILAIAQAEQPWRIKSSEFSNLQRLIRQANSSLMREMHFDYEPLQSLISIYNDQFLCSPQNQIKVDFEFSNDVISMIHKVAASDWFTSVDESGDKEGLSFFFMQHINLKYKDIEKSVKRLEVVCRRVKESANDFVKAPNQKVLGKLRARVFKSVLVEQSLKLAFAPFGYTFCKLMTQKEAWERSEIDSPFKSNLRDVLQRFINLDYQLTFLVRADFSNPVKILSHFVVSKSPEVLEAQSLAAFIANPPTIPLLDEVDSVMDGKGNLDRFYGGEFKGKQPLSVFSIKSSLHAYLLSWHSFFRPGKVASREQLAFKAPVTIKKLLSSSEKIISFKLEEQDVYMVLSDPSGKSADQSMLINEIIICQAVPQASAPNRLVLLEHNNDTVLSFASSDAAADARNAILDCQLLSLSLSGEKQSSPRWQSSYAVKSFMLQFEYDFLFARLAARKFLEKFYPGESTFVDISDYSSRSILDQEASASCEFESRTPKVEKVPGGCLHFAITLVPEAHPLAEDRVATIALVGALDLPVPDSLKDKLSGAIQNVYFVIERGFSRTVSQPKVDCEGRPQFVDKLDFEVFQGSQAALVEFDQENSMITVKIHRKAPPKSKAMQYPQQESEDKGKGNDGEEEDEEVDDATDELLAFCEFNLWDLVDIERGNNQVDLLERISKTFDCLTPQNAIRVLNNQCHPSMTNLYGRSLIELSDFKKSIEDGEPQIQAGGVLGSLMGKMKGAFQGTANKARDALDAAKEAVLEKFDAIGEDVEECVPQADGDPEAADLQTKVLIAQKQFKKTLQSLRTVVGGQSQDSCGSIIKKYQIRSSILFLHQASIFTLFCSDFLKQTRASSFQYFEFWLQSSSSRPFVDKQLLQTHYSEEDVKRVCGEATAQYMVALKGCNKIFDSEMMSSLRPVVLKCLGSVRDKATEFGELSNKHFELTCEKHEELEKLCGEFDLNPNGFDSLSSLFGFWWRGAAPRYSHMSVITREESNFQLLRYQRNGKSGNPQKKAELEAKMNKSAERISLLKSQVPDKCREFCSVMLSVFGDAYAYDCALSDAVHADHRRAKELNDVLKNLNSDMRIIIPSRFAPPCLSYEAFVNCFGGLENVTIGLEPRSIAVMSQPLAAVSAHVIASLSQVDGQVSVSRHLLRLADQISSGDWAQWLASTSIDPIIVNKTSEAYMLNYAHMSGNLRAKAFSTFMQWSSVYRRLLPGKGHIEVPEFARMHHGDSSEVFEISQVQVWSSKMVQAVKEVIGVMRGIDDQATYNRSFIDVCVTTFRHMRTFCITLRNSSVVYEGVLTSHDFWIACVGSQQASDWISTIRAHKSCIKECLNSLFAQDFSALISSTSRLFAQMSPQPPAMQKDVWQCASLAIVTENCARAGDLIGVVLCCCSMTDIVVSNAESMDRLLRTIISSLGFDDEDGTIRIPFIVDALFQVASGIRSKAARSEAFSLSFAREFCEQAALTCDRILAPLLQGIDEMVKQAENCACRLREAATCAEFSNMPTIAEKWVKANRVQILEAISSFLPQLSDYSWTSEAFAQAWVGLKLLSLLCASADSEILSVMWVSIQFLTAGSSTELSLSCPEFHKIFMRCSSGSRNYNFAASGSGIIHIPDVVLSSAESCRKLCKTFSSDCSAVDCAQGLSDFTTKIVTSPNLLTVSSSFLHLRSIKKLFAGSFGSATRFFQNIGHVNVLRLSLLLETKKFLEAIFLLKHFQTCCLNQEGSDSAAVALVVDFCVAGLIAHTSKELPSLSSPSGANLLFTMCSCSSLNHTLPLKQFSEVLHAAIAPKDISQNDMELAVFLFNSVSECFGKSFSIDVESYSASVRQFLERSSVFLSTHASASQDFVPLVRKLTDWIGPVLSQNPKLLGSASVIEANKAVATKVKSLSLELAKSTFNWTGIRSCLLDILNSIVAADATVAAHCCLALAASVSFSLNLKQLLRQNSKDVSSMQLLVANLFTIGCSGAGDSGDILHSICSAVLTHEDIDLMDTLCVQTRADLQADPNALEFFNTFSSKENISKLHEMQQQIQEGYEPGGHRISALRGCLVTAGDILAAAFSGSFFTHIGRSNIVLVCCRSFSAFDLQVNQVKILAAIGPTLDALFTALTAKNYVKAVDMCNLSIKMMTQHRLKEPHSFHKDYYWIICSLLLAIRVFCDCALIVQTNGPVSARLLCCIPLLMRIGSPTDPFLAILCEKFLLNSNEQKAFTIAIRGAWNLLRASRSMKDQSILGTGKNFGQFFQIMNKEANCFQANDPQRSALLKMFSPGLNRSIAQGLLDNLESCSAMCKAVDDDSTTSIINCATLSSSSPSPRCSFVEAATKYLTSDSDLREAKRLLTADFSSFNFMVKKAIDLKFTVNKESVSSAILDRVKESLESCNGDDDDAESEESQSVMSQVVDALTPKAVKQILPAVVTVVQICSKDVPAILRKLTNEYFLNREAKFQLLRSEDDCLEQGIPFNPAQLAEPGNYIEITKSISNPLYSKYIKIVAEKAENEIGPIVNDIIFSTVVQAVLKAPPLNVLSPKTYYHIIMTAIKAAFAATVVLRIRSINELEVHYSHLLMYAKLVPAKERLQIVAQNYFSTISALLQPSILIHAAAFSACAKAIFLSVNLSALPSDDAISDWKKLKNQLCDCGDANVAAFLSNHRRSNAVMQLSLSCLSLLRPLRAAFASNTLFSAAECLNQHAEAIKLKLDSDFEDWDFFADDFDNRLECLFQQGQSSGLKVFVAACMREAGVMVLTHKDVSESSQSLLAVHTKIASATPQRISVGPNMRNARAASLFKAQESPQSATASSPLQQSSKGQHAALLARESPQSNLTPTSPTAHLQQSSQGQHSTLGDKKAAAEKQSLLANLSTLTSFEIEQRVADATKKLVNTPESEKHLKQALDEAVSALKDHLAALAESEKHALLVKLPSSISEIELLIVDTEKMLSELSEQETHRKQALGEALSLMKDKLACLVAAKAEEQVVHDMQQECKMHLTKNALQPRLPSSQRTQCLSNLVSYLNRLESCLKDFKQADSSSRKTHATAELVSTVSASIRAHQEFESRVESVLKDIGSVQANFAAKQVSLHQASAISVKYRDMMSRDESLSLSTVASSSEAPEVKVSINAVLDLCKLMIQQADNEAVAFVQTGSSLRKYARDKILKKTRHEPVASTVKIASGVTLLWGSHKVGPQIVELSPGPSQALLDSGLLGSGPNLNLHLHFSVADSSVASGRETIDFVGSSEADVSMWLHGFKIVSKK